MDKIAKVIDLTRSYIPVDPQSFTENLHATAREDSPEDMPPILAYDGQNFLPTSYGYKSFFSIQDKMLGDPLPSRCDVVLLAQSKVYINVLIALCEDGIWTRGADSTTGWEKVVALTVPEEGAHLDWSYAAIEDKIYCYRANGPQYYCFDMEVSGWQPDSFPMFNVAGLQVATHDSVGANAFAAGNYEISIAYWNIYGALSAPMVVGTRNSPSDSWAGHVIAPIIHPAIRYRVYVRNTSTQVVRYADGKTSYPSGIPVIPLFINESTSLPGGLPDTSWVTQDTGFYIYQPTAFTPTFLNMEGQHGIFKAGMRLGFWDSMNSIAWSSIDDLSDFTPSLTTLAGSSIFSAVKGRVVHVIPHGQGFIIYATKSIVLVRQREEATFQWEPEVLLSDSGIAYPQQACSASPDTMHFAWTDTGIVKIEEGRLEYIVPEVYDYLRAMQSPVGLKCLEGRYLFFQILEQDYLLGRVKFDASMINPTKILFAGDPLPPTWVEEVNLTGTSVCEFYETLANGAGSQDAAAAAHASAGTPPKKEGTFYKPVWKTYLAMGGFKPPENISWGVDPCSVANPNPEEGQPNPYPMSPQGLMGKLARASTGKANKVVLDGNVSGPQLLAIQELIWKQEDAEREAFIAALEDRAFSRRVITQSYNQSGPLYSISDHPSWIPAEARGHMVGASSGLPEFDPTNEQEGSCTIGEFAMEWTTGPSWSTSCAFGITRYCTKKGTLKTRSKSYNQIQCSIGTGYNGWIHWHGSNNYTYPSDPAAYANELTSSEWYTLVDTIYDNGGNSVIYKVWSSVNNWWHSDPRLSAYYFTPIRTENVFQVDAHNVFEDIQEGVFGIETAFTAIEGWTYEGEDGNPYSLDSPDHCPLSPSDYNRPTSQGYTLPERKEICSIPFQPIHIPGFHLPVLEWPDQEITIPGGDFLLQRGSIGPVYPTYVGAYVFDLHLKKWGKMVQDHKVLLDYSPINAQSGSIVPYEVFGIQGGILDAAGNVRIFNEATTANESVITYGKVGLYRLGNTDLEEVVAHFKRESTGYLRIEPSFDGRTINISQSAVIMFEAALSVTIPLSLSAKWYNITISGSFDLTHLQVRAHKSSRR